MACKANCRCCKCAKKTARHKRTKRKSANGRRPFAPFYSTSTISKAVNSVYGPPMPITRTSYMPGEHRGGPPELKPEITLSFRETPLTTHPEHGGAFASQMARHGLDNVQQPTRTGDANAMQPGTVHNHPHVNNHGVAGVASSSRVPQIQADDGASPDRFNFVPDGGTNNLTFSTANLPAGTSQSTSRTPYMIGRNGKPTRNYAKEHQRLTGVEQSTRETPPHNFVEQTPIGNSFSPHPSLTRRRTANTASPLDFGQGAAVYEFGKGGTRLDFDHKKTE